MSEPVEYQFRTRPDWIPEWNGWNTCSKESAEAYEKTPYLHDWHYEVRRLYTSLPEQLSAYQRGYLDGMAKPCIKCKDQTDWEAVAADQAMTIALLKTELQEFANKEADAVEVALTESGWVWDGDQWQRPPQTWAGLTDEEVKQCFDSVSTQDCQNYEHWRSLCARNIESKLKEKNT